MGKIENKVEETERGDEMQSVGYRNAKSQRESRIFGEGKRERR